MFENAWLQWLIFSLWLAWLAPLTLRTWHREQKTLSVTEPKAWERWRVLDWSTGFASAFWGVWADSAALVFYICFVDAQHPTFFQLFSTFNCNHCKRVQGSNIRCNKKIDPTWPDFIPFQTLFLAVPCLQHPLLTVASYHRPPLHTLLLSHVQPFLKATLQFKDIWPKWYVQFLPFCSFCPFVSPRIAISNSRFLPVAGLWPIPHHPTWPRVASRGPGQTTLPGGWAPSFQTTSQCFWCFLVALSLLYTSGSKNLKHGSTNSKMNGSSPTGTIQLMDGWSLWMLSSTSTLPFWWPASYAQPWSFTSWPVPNIELNSELFLRCLSCSGPWIFSPLKMIATSTQLLLGISWLTWSRICDFLFLAIPSVTRVLCDEGLGL